ncbi:MAG: hypothetical protein J5494_03510, partial [Candidatus Methanomethylophilaceae archaeon]|nr:hypothetical protein [Candidatus Methanomethylophilaceae archaeon]
MNIPELTAYAKEKYGAEESVFPDDSPGLSVLINPGTQKWAAVLIRRKDPATGEDAEFCDIRCGNRTG